MPHNTLVVVMGVSGSGKSTVGAALAQRLRVPFADADDFHPPANIAKMTAGEALDDDDRCPWLEPIGEWLADHARRWGDQLLGAEAEVPRPAAAPRAGRRVPAPRRQPRGDRPPAGQPARPLHAGLPARRRSSRPSSRSRPTSDGVVIDVDQSVDEIVQEYVDQHLAADHEGDLMSPDHLLGRTDSSNRSPRAGSWSSRRSPGIAVIVVLITLAQAAPVPRADPRRPDRRHRRRRERHRRRSRRFTTGFGTTAAGVGILIALGAMFGKLLADSGGADQIVDTIVGRASAADAAVGDGRASARSSACRCSSRSASCC